MNITIEADKPEEIADPDGEVQDAAAVAFELLREEVALCRRAVAGLAAERAAIQIPDYSKTLNQMAAALNTTSRQLDALSQKPALALTPQQWSYQIAAAGNDVRRTEQDTLERARTGFVKVAQELSARLASARQADQQHKWLMRSGIAGILVGAVLGLSLAFIASHIDRMFGASPVASSSPPLEQGSTRTVAREPLPVGETGCASGAGAFAGNRLQGPRPKSRGPKLGGRHSEAR
jgi:F0F1-type ATP synthase assembly protein I